ncbi:MAG: hypothetical protein EON53_07090 [Actinomycetales bacterium]|nr:MAG: hypothetical protein EON53_07090 [Actinomycetales bacterium]
MIVAGHQADLLPWSGFWFTMAKADHFDVMISDQFQPTGYHRRVLMRGTWASVPVVPCGAGTLIGDVRIDPVAAPRALADLVRARYRSSRNWEVRGPRILEMLHDVRTEHLWQLNLSLILGVRDLLEIRTPVTVSEGTGGARTSAGTGPDPEDTGVHIDVDVDVDVSRHQAMTGDSILTLLMDFDDPMELVLAERDEHAEIRA